MSERLSREQVQEFRDRATDGGDHEWGWYVDDVPALCDEVIALMDETASIWHDMNEAVADEHARVQVLEERNRALSEALGGLFAWVSDFLNLGTEYEGTLYEGDLPMEDEVPQIRRARATLESQAIAVTREDEE